MLTYYDRMSEPVVRVYVIGQTPRPDLTGNLESRFPSVRFDVLGALDGIPLDEIEQCAVYEYPLETRLSDGSRVVVEASYIRQRIEHLLNGDHGDADAHLILCAGPFAQLVPPARTGRGAAPLIRPFDRAVEVLRGIGAHHLEIAVPFEGQAVPALEKWSVAGFAGHAHVLTNRSGDASLAAWLADRVRGRDAGAIVFDYVGYPSDALEEISDATGLPVYDLGHLALDALQEVLSTNDHR